MSVSVRACVRVRVHVRALLSAPLLSLTRLLRAPAGFKQFLPSTTLLQKLGLDTCLGASWLCQDVLFWLCGPSKHVNSTRLDVYIAETPAGTSVRNMMHWSQVRVCVCVCACVRARALCPRRC